MNSPRLKHHPLDICAFIRKIQQSYDEQQLQVNKTKNKTLFTLYLKTKMFLTLRKELKHVDIVLNRSRTRHTSTHSSLTPWDSETATECRAMSS